MLQMAPRSLKSLSLSATTLALTASLEADPSTWLEQPACALTPEGIPEPFLIHSTGFLALHFENLTVMKKVSLFYSNLISTDLSLIFTWILRWGHLCFSHLFNPHAYHRCRGWKSVKGKPVGKVYYERNKTKSILISQKKM